jgi:hypothetical protein
MQVLALIKFVYGINFLLASQLVQFNGVIEHVRHVELQSKHAYFDNPI